MSDVIEQILPQVPVEGIALHIGRSRLSMGDAVTPRLMAEGAVGLWARTRRPWAGLVPVWRDSYLGLLGPIASQILAPALQAGLPLRMRVVMLTPEHLSHSGTPEVHVSVWGHPKLLAPFLASLPPEDEEPARSRKTRGPG